MKFFQSLSDISKNKIRAMITESAKAIALMCASGTLMQTFLSALGFEGNLIYLHTMLLQTANVLTMLLAANWTENRNPMKCAALSAIPTGLLFLVYLPIAIAANASLPVYLLLLGVGVMQQIFVGLTTVCDYKMPYYIYRADEYGQILSVCGILSSVFTYLMGSLISYLTEKYPFSKIMAVSFGVCAVMMLIVALAVYCQKNLLADKETVKNSKEKEIPISLVGLFRHPDFYRLIPANLLRGFASGAIGVLAVIALELEFTEALTVRMVSVQSIASLLSCAFFALGSKRITPKAALLAGSIAILTLPLMMLKNSALFLVLYAVIIFGRTLVDYGVPAALIKVVPLEIAGPYHAWRLVLQNAGSILATAVATVLPSFVFLILAALCQIISGISFFVIKKYQPK